MRVSLKQKRCPHCNEWYDIASNSCRNDELTFMCVNKLCKFYMFGETIEIPDSELIVFIRNIATNYDHDESAHKYGTNCRVCDAEKLLGMESTK